MQVILNSETIEKLEWCNNKLKLLYKTGITYIFYEVLEELAIEMSKSELPGKYLCENIKGKYRYSRGDNNIHEDVPDDLAHYYHHTHGLWCTDRPDLIPDDIKHLFFQI